jgi:hypothetical protein
LVVLKLAFDCFWINKLYNLLKYIIFQFFKDKNWSNLLILTKKKSKNAQILSQNFISKLEIKKKKLSKFQGEIYVSRAIRVKGWKWYRSWFAFFICFVQTDQFSVLTYCVPWLVRRVSAVLLSLPFYSS